MNEIERTLLTTLFWLSLTATCYTYFLYPLLLKALSSWATRKNRQPGRVGLGPPSHANDPLPTVTMVISAYNEEAVLPAKLANCQALNYPTEKLSFVIGSDGSDDRTAGILNAVTDDRYLTIVNRFRSGKASMLNQMIKHVATDIVVFSDANTMYHPDAVGHLVAPFTDRRVGCVNGKLELSDQSHDEQACRPEGLYWRYENRIKQMEGAIGAVPTINGGIFAIRRELYHELPPQSITEDQVLGMKIMVRGHRCLFAHRARASESISSWAGELRRRIRISAGNFQALVMVREILNPRCGRISFTFISHKLLRWLVPFFLATMLLCNVLLVGKPFYGATLLLQGLFYLSGAIGVMLPNLAGALKVLTIPKYFLTMNVAILIGLARFLTGRQAVTWAKADR